MSKNERRVHPARAADPTGAIVHDHLGRLQDCLRHLEADQVAAVAERLWAVARSGGQIIVAGNGGSAATASHMALDLGKSTLGRTPRPAALRVRTIALNDPGPMITAWANDHGYERVFAEQIATLARPGDAAVFFSVSGNSPNVVAAARAARSIGATVIGLLGRPGGVMRELSDLAIVVPSEDYGVVEDVHLAINHIVTRCLRTAIESSVSSDRERSRARPATRPRRPLPVGKRLARISGKRGG